MQGFKVIILCRKLQNPDSNREKVMRLQNLNMKYIKKTSKLNCCKNHDFVQQKHWDYLRSHHF